LTLTRAFTTEASSPTAGAESAARLAAAISESVSAKCGRLVCTSAGESAIGWLAEEASDPEESRLSPDWRPIILVRKPLIGTVAANVLAHGTGAINVDGCRIGWAGPEDAAAAAVGFSKSMDAGRVAAPTSLPTTYKKPPYEPDKMAGRWPANVCLDEEAAAMLDEQSDTHSARVERPRTPGGTYDGSTGIGFAGIGVGEKGFRFGDSGGASRFFYTAKASQSDRDEHLFRDGGSGALRDGGRTGPRGNHHPTVKPTDLMRWLCRLVTPPGGLILDPFCGSGSTGVAALAEGFRFVGIEMDPEYAEIARRRIGNVAPLFAAECNGQASTH
jgi:site-specific DNA-methyltransferase (adenine-specific)